MKKFWTIMGGASLLLAPLVTGPVMAQYSLNVRDADIRAFIQDAARATGRTFIIDNRVQGKVSVVTDRPLSRTEYFEIFLSTLRANGLVAVPAPGGAYRIQPVDGAAGQPSGVGRAANRNQFVTEVFRLRSIDAASALETLRPLVSREGSVTANRAGNSIVVADYADNVMRIRQVVARIDRDVASTQMIALKNAGAREVAQSLQQLVGTGGGGAEGAAAALAGASVVAVDSSNSVLIRGEAGTVARLAEVARNLDRQAANGADIRVYWLEHADAGQLLPVIQQLLGQPVSASTQAALSPARSSVSGSSSGSGSSGSAAAPAPAAFSAPAASSGGVSGSTGIVTRGPAVVTRFEGANAIVIAANPDVQRQVGEVIRQLDTKRDQILVEAIVVEISDAAAKKLGVQFLIGSTDTGFAVTNYSNASPNILTLAGAYAATRLNTTTTTVNGQTTVTETNSQLGDTLQQAAVSSLLNAAGGIGGVATRLGSNGVFGAIVNAIKTDTQSNLLSTPWLYTLDNQQARILVGQEIPITTGQALSQNFDNQFRTVQRQNVGIQLEVRPQVNADDEIKLFLRQEVSSIAGPVSNDNSDLIINKREIESTITVGNGQIVALGGLLDDNERRTLEKIPLLGDLPAIGRLFQSKSKQRTKNNLVVFIRPTIVRSAQEAAAISARRYGYARDMQRLYNPDREPTIDELVRDYIGAAPPEAPPAGPDDQVYAAPPSAAGTPPPPAAPAASPIRPVDIPPSTMQDPPKP
ncbi:MAG: type II secretion system secretin GspD [Sphingobium sp.]|nr:type II secretion system secretin GspD [Sphingobium sp.]